MTGCSTAGRPCGSPMRHNPEPKTHDVLHSMKGSAGGARTSDDCVVDSRVAARQSHALSCRALTSKRLPAAAAPAPTRLLGRRARRVPMRAAQSRMDMQSSPGPCRSSMVGCFLTGYASFTASQRTAADHWLASACTLEHTAMGNICSLMRSTRGAHAVSRTLLRT